MPISSPHSKNEILTAFGMAVRRTRKKLSISQEDLAHKCSIDRAYMGAIERGEQNPGLLHISKIALALDMKIEKLMEAAEL